MIKYLLKGLLNVFVNILVGIFIIFINLLPITIYENREDYILGEWSIYLVWLSFGFTAFLIGRGVEYGYKEEQERALKS